MKTGLLGQKLTMIEELKISTYLHHVHLQAISYFQALVSCQLPLESYVGQLRALAIIHGALEHELEASPNQVIQAVWQADLKRMALLNQDLGYFSPRVVADVKASVDEALKVAEQIRLRSVQQPVSLLGYLYVLEGSALGAKVLMPQFARAFLLAGTEGLSYLNHYGAETYGKWQQFQQRINTTLGVADHREIVLQAACELFDHLKNIFTALYPLTPESMTYVVTSINPEAGRHPIPADKDEVEASLRAADRCWQRFPYYEARYGERGSRFAKSDGAWLATLYQYDQRQVRQQIEWLGRLLAVRGMPRIMLQVQLEMLVEELGKAVPAKRKEYEKLLFAANELHASRTKWFDEASIQALSHDFDIAVGPEWAGRFKDTGVLLVAAVADEKDGIEAAATSIEGWMTDASRFPAPWIEAVRSIIAKARGHR